MSKLNFGQHLALFLGYKKIGEHSPLFYGDSHVKNISLRLGKATQHDTKQTGGTIRGVCLAVPLVPIIAVNLKVLYTMLDCLSLHCKVMSSFRVDMSSPSAEASQGSKEHIVSVFSSKYKSTAKQNIHYLLAPAIVAGPCNSALNVSLQMA